MEYAKKKLGGDRNEDDKFSAGDKDLKRIKKLSQKEGGSKSETVRELLDYGWEYLMIRQYKEGYLSLSRLGEKLEKQPEAYRILIISDELESFRGYFAK